MPCCTVQWIYSTNAVWGNTMATTNSTTLTFRVGPGLKDAVRTAAEQEPPRIAKMNETMIRAHCARTGIAIVEPCAVADAEHKPRKRSK